jgi:hypothetical protein
MCSTTVSCTKCGGKLHPTYQCSRCASDNVEPAPFAPSNSAIDAIALCNDLSMDCFIVEGPGALKINEYIRRARSIVQQQQCGGA